MKVKLSLILFFMISSSFAMQPMQWFRDVAPAVHKEMEAEVLETTRKEAVENAQKATFELILLLPKITDSFITVLAKRDLIQKLIDC